MMKTVGSAFHSKDYIRDVREDGGGFQLRDKYYSEHYGPHQAHIHRQYLDQMYADLDWRKRIPCELEAELATPQTEALLPSPNRIASNERISILPPTPAEWTDMADEHLYWLRAAWVFTNRERLGAEPFPIEVREEIGEGLRCAGDFHDRLAKMTIAARERLSTF